MLQSCHVYIATRKTQFSEEQKAKVGLILCETLFCIKIRCRLQTFFLLEQILNFEPWPQFRKKPPLVKKHLEADFEITRVKLFIKIHFQHCCDCLGS